MTGKSTNTARGRADSGSFPGSFGEIGPAEPEATELDLLERALHDGDAAQCRQAVRALVASGLTEREIADHCVPELAHRMGIGWCEDQLSFAHVTIGMSRLQRLLRDLGPEFQADGEIGQDCAAVLLLVPETEQHTLGAILLSGQLRRRGLSVRLLLGFRPEDAGVAWRSGDYDAVMISAASGHSHATLCDVVHSVRQSAPTDIPVCVGGSFAEIPGSFGPKGGNVHVSNDIDESLRLCGLTVRSRRPFPSATET